MWYNISLREEVTDGVIFTNAFSSLNFVFTLSEGGGISMDNNKSERDDFWNIDKLVPKKTSKLSPFATRPAVRDYTVSEPEKRGPQNNVDNNEGKLTFSDMKGFSNSEDVTYYPENTLIKSITVKRYKEKYDFYDSFRRAALMYFECIGSKCEFAQYYSYVPQYSQLTKPQRDYYFYWRTELRSGRYIKTDYSYLYLYVYEIINLPDKLPPEEGIRLLCRVWRAYRKDLPRIDLYFSSWVRDYCLVHNLPCPYDALRDFLFDIIRISDFKEYYFTEIGTDSRNGVWTLLAYFSDYDWQSGLLSVMKKYNGTEELDEKREIYKNILEGAMRTILPTVWKYCLSYRTEENLAIISRNAFRNSLCTHSVKSHLEIKYYPLDKVADLRLGITAAVRYTENKLRAVFGVKSRLSVKDIPTPYRELIDCYFDALIEKNKRIAAKKNQPEYERLYDAPSEELSFIGADEIERISWDTTARLCENNEDIESESINSVDAENYSAAEYLQENPNTDCAVSNINYGLDKEELIFIASLLEGVKTSDISSVGMVEHINEAFADGFGDVVIEETDKGFEIIEDYVEDVTEWLKKLMK